MPERHRDRQLLLDQLDHADVAEIALAEIEAREIPHHQRETLRRRLVEAELRLELLDELRIEPLRAAVFRIDGIGGGADLGPCAEIAAGGARYARAAPVSAPESCAMHALDRPAGRELHDHERDEQDAEQCRDHQQHAAGDIGAHGYFACSSLAALAGSNHQVSGAPRHSAAWSTGSRTGPNRRSSAKPCSSAESSNGRSAARDLARGRYCRASPASARQPPFRPAHRRPDRRSRQDCWSPWSWRSRSKSNFAASFPEFAGR